MINDEYEEDLFQQEVICSCCKNGFSIFATQEEIDKAEIIKDNSSFPSGICVSCQLKKLKKSKMIIFIVLAISMVLCILDVFNSMFNFQPILRVIVPIVMLINVIVLLIIFVKWSKVQPKLNYKKK